MLIRAVVISWPSEARGWSLSSLLNLSCPECFPEPMAVW